MPDLASEIRERVTMFECAEFYGLSVNGANFAQCPFHDGDRTPSLKIYSGNRGWHCFGCDRSGSVIDFVMQYFGEDFKSACIQLNNDFALGLPLDRPKSYREQRELCKKYRERTEARRRKAKETEQAEKNYNQALTLFCSCDYIMLHAPPMSDAWCKALKHIATAKYNLDEAALEVQLLRERQRNNNTGLDS